jgi:hypothetical protein
MPNGHNGNADTRIVVSIRFESQEAANEAASALKIDDDDFIHTSVEGSIVRGEVGANSVEGARRAADDWLACLIAVVKNNKGSHDP